MKRVYITVPRIRDSVLVEMTYPEDMDDLAESLDDLVMSWNMSIVLRPPGFPDIRRRLTNIGKEVSGDRTTNMILCNLYPPGSNHLTEIQVHSNQSFLGYRAIDLSEMQGIAKDRFFDTLILWKSVVREPKTIQCSGTSTKIENVRRVVKCGVDVEIRTQSCPQGKISNDIHFFGLACNESYTFFYPVWNFIDGILHLPYDTPQQLVTQDYLAINRHNVADFLLSYFESTTCLWRQIAKSFIEIIVQYQDLELAVKLFAKPTKHNVGDIQMKRIPACWLLIYDDNWELLEILLDTTSWGNLERWRHDYQKLAETTQCPELLSSMSRKAEKFQGILSSAIKHDSARIMRGLSLLWHTQYDPNGLFAIVDYDAILFAQQENICLPETLYRCGMVYIHAIANAIRYDFSALISIATKKLYDFSTNQYQALWYAVRFSGNPDVIKFIAYQTPDMSIRDIKPSQKNFKNPKVVNEYPDLQKMYQVVRHALQDNDLHLFEIMTIGWKTPSPKNGCLNSMRYTIALYLNITALLLLADNHVAQKFIECFIQSITLERHQNTISQIIRLYRDPDNDARDTVWVGRAYPQAPDQMPDRETYNRFLESAIASNNSKLIEFLSTQFGYSS